MQNSRSQSDTFVQLNERKSQIFEPLQKDNMNGNMFLQRKNRKTYNASTLLGSPEYY